MRARVLLATTTSVLCLLSAPALAQEISVTEQASAAASVEIAQNESVIEETTIVETTEVAQNDPVGPTSESAKSSEFSINWTVTVADGRLFKDQGFTLTDQPTIQNSVTACTESGTCFGWWNSWSPSRRIEDEETDLSASHTFGAGATQLRVEGMFIIALGPETWDLNATVSHKVNDNLSFGVRGELMRGGFDDSVVRGFVSYTETRGSWDFTVTPSVAYSDWSGRVGFGLSASTGYTFDNGVRLGLGYDGYVNKESDGFFNLNLSRNF